nr:unnamed protein product [Callosobruchus analis]
MYCDKNLGIKSAPSKLQVLRIPTPSIRCTKKHDCHSSLGSRSICTKRMECACKPFHHIHLGQCVKNRDLEDACDHDHQCYCGAGCESRIACIDKQCFCREGYKPYGSRRCIDDPLYVKHHHTSHHHAVATSGVSHHHHQHNATTTERSAEQRITYGDTTKLLSMSSSSKLTTSCALTGIVTMLLVLQSGT